MWDNRDRRQAAEDEGRKAPPAWKCKDGKYQDGVASGCQGLIWPSDPNEDQRGSRAASQVERGDDPRGDCEGGSYGDQADEIPF